MLDGMKKGYLWIGLGVVMGIIDLTIRPVFTLKVTSGFFLPLPLLAIAYGILSVISARMATRTAELTGAELDQWGEALERATPRIIALIEAKLSSQEIVETVQRETKIPEMVLIKYLFALRRHTQEAADEARSDERRKL